MRAALEKLKAEHPEITITEAFNFVDPVVENYDGSMALLYEGAALAVLVVFLFLRDWRATLVAATALPLSIIPAFAVMYLIGFTLNVVTLLALSLVVGILVDDAIVEIENIMRHLRMGKTPFQAAMEAADEIGLAVIATTFTLIAVFLPTAFMSGVPGKFFVQFGWTAAIAVFFSLVVARMLTPMMAAYLLKPPKKRVPRGAGWIAVYMRWARWCLQHRVLTTIGAAASSSSARSRWCRCCRPASSRPTTCRRRRCTLVAAAGQHLRADAAPRPKQARAIVAEEPARQAGLHRDRRRQRPAAIRSRRSGARPKCARRR